MKQKLQDTLSRMQRERERDLRNFKKMEMQLKIALESLAQIKSHHERVLLEVCLNKLMVLVLFIILKICLTAFSCTTIFTQKDDDAVNI